MKGPDLDNAIRALVKDQMDNGAKLTLKQVAHICKVDYQRLWRFLRVRKPAKTLPLFEAQAIYETLTGKPLIND